MRRVRLQIFGHLLDLARLTRLDCRAIEIEIDRVGGEKSRIRIHRGRIEANILTNASSHCINRPDVWILVWRERRPGYWARGIICSADVARHTGYRRHSNRLFFATADSK